MYKMIQERLGKLLNHHNLMARTSDIIAKGTFTTQRVGNTRKTVSCFETEDGFLVGHGESISAGLFNEETGRLAAEFNCQENLAKELAGYELYTDKRRMDWHVMNVLAAAKAAHEVNRIYCSSIGDNSQAAWDLAPTWQKNSAVLGVLFHFENPMAGPEGSHESWTAEKVRTGWVYGPVKDADRKTHPCLVPYKDLPQEQQLKDSLFVSVVKPFMPNREEY